MTSQQFRKLALGLPEAAEAEHHGHPDFRVNGKIFATLGYPDDGCGTIMLDAEAQAFFLKLDAAALRPAAGAWGRQGATVVELRAAKAAIIREALEAAWRRRAPKRLLR